MKTKKWLIIIASIAVIIILDLIIYIATYKSSYEVSKQTLEQQAPIMTELFHQNKTVLDNLVSQTIDGPDYDVGFYNSVVTPRTGLDYVPDGINELAQQLSDAGINLINIRKSERHISIWIYDGTVSGTAATIFPRPSGAHYTTIYYVYSENKPKDGNSARHTNLADNWFLLDANPGAA